VNHSTDAVRLGPSAERPGRRTVIGVMGAGQPSPSASQAAYDLGRLAAEAGWAVLTGGRPAGVMDAACAGAKSVPGSLTIGILPTGREGPVSPHVDIAVYTGAGESRNVVNVLTSDVVVACGVEGPGTASEVALALRLTRPTILLAADPAASVFFRGVAGAAGLHEVPTPEAAIELIEHRLGIPRLRRANDSHSIA
jgi:uncharacterized protein (TIGR00725 family)